MLVDVQNVLVHANKTYLGVCYTDIDLATLKMLWVKS